jgi:hypothetical protein
MKSTQDGHAVYELLLRRMNRRKLLVNGSFLAVAGLGACSEQEAGSASGLATDAPAATPSTFATIAGSAEDRVVVPEGFTSEVLIRWGDPVVAGSAGMPIDGLADGSLLEPGTGAAQSQCFGVNCDGMGIVEIDDDRIVLCVNHETPESSRVFPGWRAALRGRSEQEFLAEHPDVVAAMQAGVGVSVLELRRSGDSWRLVADSPLNRRITANTPMEFSGPAANHPWLGGSDAAVGRCLGTFGNCAAGSTPWGTYLTAEENTNDFFGNAETAEFDPMLRRANERFGLRNGPSLFRWELGDERFDFSRNPSESMKFGWIVEIDPLNPDRPIRKRTALGKFRHEGATTVLNGANRPVAYMGDDAGFEYFYKFVSDGVYDPANPGDTDELLDVGTLYVARLNDDGSGEWLPLRYGARPELTAGNGFTSQADVVLRCREAADLVGATPLDRPEDVAVHPLDGRVYLACTQGTRRGFRPPPRPPQDAEADAEEAPPIPGVDAANPRGPNPYGHILEFTEAGGDAAAERFNWEVFLLAGDPAAEGLASEATAGRLSAAVAYYAGRSDSAGLSAFANPDNLGFDAAGNLWIVTDGSQPNSNNNGCFVCPTAGPERGLVRQFMSGPVGAEISGCTFSPDGETLFLSVQHPGSGGSIEEPSSHWPDGGNAQPRSSLIAIRSVDPMRRFHT